MLRRTKISAAGIALLAGIIACDDALLYQPEPLERQFSVVAPTCDGLPATIYPGVPGPGTIANNALGGLTIRGTGGPDVIVGSNGADSIFGFNGDDKLCGRDGNDVLSGGAGGDKLYGNNDFDIADYTLSPVGVNATMQGYGSKGHAHGDELATTEGIIGTRNADVLTGDGQANLLIGAGGADRLEGRGGADIMEGGPGLDEALYTSAPGMVVADLGAAVGRFGVALGDTYLNIENLLGSAYGDTLVGSGAINRIDGAGGADVIMGGPEADKLYGGLGNDRLYGEAGADFLDGSTGINTLDGGAETDSGVLNCEDTMFSLETFTQEPCPASNLTSLVSVDSVLIRADNTGSSVITIQLKNEQGVNLTEGGLNVFVYTSLGSVSNGSASGPQVQAVDMLNGTYRATLIGGLAPGVATVRAIIRTDTVVDNASLIVSLGRSNVWTGNVDTDWTKAGNWSTGFAATTADSVTIPIGRPNYPVFFQNHAAGQIDITYDLTTPGLVNLGSFDFTLTGHIRAHPGGFIGTGRVIGNGIGELSGDFRHLRINEGGRYSLIANINIIGGRLVVQGGRLRNEKFRIRVRPS